jgi:hypothetical protein
MQSLRAVGYTTSAALADLIDNSIAADARTVDIWFTSVPEPVVAIVDDGTGMDEATLVCAMRFGSSDPRDERTGMDLGRFGLGLKTASLSQCRRLTVASLRDGCLAVAVWDLDECERRGTWWLGRPDVSTIPADVRDLLSAQSRGTAVIWHRLDRLTATGGADPRRLLDSTMDDAADHLALVFHRFLAGEVVGKFEIRVNGRPIPRLDPFLEGHARGQTLHSESFRVGGQTVTVSPFVLPFPSRLKPAELDRAGGRENLKSGHGFYVYRGGRLVVPGGWFRIVPSDELIRLARVRVDVPVQLDHLWKLDIRKTVAEPPAALRPHLRRIVGEVTIRSRRVYTHKGSPQTDAERIPLWARHDLRDGAATWNVNREHPAVAAILGIERRDGDIERLLRLLESSLPLHDIHLHISNDLPIAGSEIPDEAELEKIARQIVDALRDQPMVVSRMLDRLSVTEPFNRNPDATQRIVQRLRA